MYGEGTTKAEKRRIREKAQYFVVQEGVLYHKNHNNALCRVIVNDDEKQRILTSVHADAIGGAHYGQNATIKKIIDRFWWKNVANDTRDYVRACTMCQKCNQDNKPPPSTLHSVSVREIFHRWGIGVCPVCIRIKKNFHILDYSLGYISYNCFKNTFSRRKSNNVILS